MSVFYTEPDITPIAPGTGAEWGDEINNRFEKARVTLVALRSEISIGFSWLFGSGRIVTGADNEGQIEQSEGLVLRLTPAGGATARYIVQGQPFAFGPDTEPAAISCPPNRTDCWGFLSPDPDDETQLIVLDEDWLDTPTAAQIQAMLDAGKPCLGRVTTTSEAITTYDPSKATIIRSLGALGVRQNELEARVSKLEAGGTPTGPGGPGPSGPSYASLLTFERAIDGKPGDGRATNVVVRELFEQAKAYADEQVSTGGTKLVYPPLDQIFDHIAYLYWALSKLWPEATAGAAVSVVNVKRWGDGTNDSPNFRGPSTGVVNPVTLDIDPGGSEI